MASLFPAFWSFTLVSLGSDIFIIFSGHSVALSIWKPNLQIWKNDVLVLEDFLFLEFLLLRSWTHWTGSLMIDPEVWETCWEKQGHPCRQLDMLNQPWQWRWRWCGQNYLTSPIINTLSDPREQELFLFCSHCTPSLNIVYGMWQVLSKYLLG